MADVITGTQLVTSKADLISSVVQKELAFNSMLVPTIEDVSKFAVKGAKTISFPKLTSFTVVNRAEGVAGDASALTSSVDQLALSTNAFVAWILDSFTLAQISFEAKLEFAKRAAQAQSRFVDTSIITKLASIAFEFLNVGADVDATYANMVAMDQRLREKNADPSMISIIASPKQHGVLMGLDEFKRADVYGSANIPKGTVGFIMGHPVYIHNNLAQKQLFMYEKGACAIGFQKGASYGEESALAYGVGAMKQAVDQIFGLSGLQLGVDSGIGTAVGATKTGLCIGLND